MKAPGKTGLFLLFLLFIDIPQCWVEDLQQNLPVSFFEFQHCLAAISEGVGSEVHNLIKNTCNKYLHSLLLVSSPFLCFYNHKGSQLFGILKFTLYII